MIGVRRSLFQIAIYRKPLFLIIFSVIFCGYFLLCWDWKVYIQIEKLCANYHKGLLHGDFCSVFCQQQENGEFFATCHHRFQTGKSLIYSLEIRGQKVLLKKAVPHMNISQDEKQFTKNKLKTIVRQHLNVTLSDFDIETLHSFQPKTKREFQTAVKLFENLDFLMHLVYRQYNIFPKLLGTCGDYYALENVRFLQEKIRTAHWLDRLRIALGILDFLQSLEMVHGGSVLHLCDVQLEYFGILDDGYTIKYTNTKRVYPDAVISRILAQDICKNVENEQGCEYLDCRGRFVNSTLVQIANNNLQRVCEKIFLGWKWHFSRIIIIPGLLVTEYTSVELMQLLRQCAGIHQFNGNYGSVRKGREMASRALGHRLYAILSEMELQAAHYY